MLNIQFIAVILFIAACPESRTTKSNTGRPNTGKPCNFVDPILFCVKVYTLFGLHISYQISNENDDRIGIEMAHRVTDCDQVGVPMGDRKC